MKNYVCEGTNICTGGTAWKIVMSVRKLFSPDFREKYMRGVQMKPVLVANTSNWSKVIMWLCA
jgi:hypothetical protein